MAPVAAILSSVLAWSGDFQVSPGYGGLPAGAKVSNQGLNSSRFKRPLYSLNALPQATATVGETGKPSYAYPIAGDKASVSGSLPKRSDRAAHAEGAPGTVTGIQPYRGISLCPAFFTALTDMAFGAGPLAFRPYIFPPVQTIAKASPPIPLEVGSTTVRHAAAAIAASTAFPPFLSISSPACAARDCEVATIPLFAYTMFLLDG